MKKRLSTHIDTFLYQCSADPLQQLVYMIARLSLIATPVAWVVKFHDGKEDRFFTSQDEAIAHLDAKGNKDDYLVPLFATVKVDATEREMRHLLLTPSPYEED